MKLRQCLIDVRSYVLLIVGVSLLGGCSDGESGTALPGGLPSVEAMIEDFDISPAAREDLQRIASDEAWTLQEAIYRIGWQEDFSFFVSEIRAAYPDEFAEAGILGEEGPRRVFIGFRSTVPPEIRNDPRLSHLEVDFREAVGFSEDELANQTIAVHQAMLDAGFVDVVAGPDIHTG